MIFLSLKEEKNKMARYTDMILKIYEYENKNNESEELRLTGFDSSINSAVATTKDNNEIIMKYRKIIDEEEQELNEYSENLQENTLVENIIQSKAVEDVLDASQLKNTDKNNNKLEEEPVEKNNEQNNEESKKVNKKKTFFILGNQKDNDLIKDTKIVIIKCLSETLFDKAFFNYKNIDNAMAAYLEINDIKKLIGFQYNDDIYIIAGQEMSENKIDIYVTEEDIKKFGPELNKISKFYIDNLVNKIKDREKIIYKDRIISELSQDNREIDLSYRKDLSKSAQTLKVIINKNCDKFDLRKANIDDTIFIDCSFVDTLFSDVQFKNAIFLNCTFDRTVFCRSNLQVKFLKCHGNYFDDNGELIRL